MYIVGRNIAKEGETFSIYQEALHDTQTAAIEDYRQRDKRGDRNLFIAKLYSVDVQITLIDMETGVMQDRSNET